MLEAAHRGYDYQDLLVALRLVDLLLDPGLTVNVDDKMVSDDRFDDLTITNSTGVRFRAQFKRRDDPHAALSASTFTNDSRKLRLDRLVACAIAERDGPGSQASDLRFRIVMTDSSPTDQPLRNVLVPANPDPGPFVSGMKSLRFQFFPEKLWPITCAASDIDNNFTFLQSAGLQRSDVIWFCERTVVEVRAPVASFDLLDPGAAEQLLIDRVRLEIGAGMYPNEARSPVDISRALIAAARSYRQRTATPSCDNLLYQTQLRSDFGAVARKHPVEPTLQIQRAATIEGLLIEAVRAADDGKPLLVAGPPGQGKSWAAYQLAARMNNSEWVVADHYLFLGEMDGERARRVQSEVIFGSLLARLSELVPRLAEDQRPRFAASGSSLSQALAAARRTVPGVRIALIVDGLDHITRVVGPTIGQIDPSEAAAQELAAFILPKGCTLIILSQPGDHLRPFKACGAYETSLPGMNFEEVASLARRIRALDGPFSIMDAVSRNDDADDGARRFVGALAERSGGNALYATYLCREIVQHPLGPSNPTEHLEQLPPYDGDIENYYRYLVRVLRNGADWVADILGLLDFAVTRSELEEIRPSMAPRVAPAIEQLSPVLVERAAQGGIRIYHESFARFLRQRLDACGGTVAVLDEVIRWLQSKGFFESSKSFRFLIPALARAGHGTEALKLLERDYVERAVARGFMPSAIRANLRVGVQSAVELEDWASVIRCTQLALAVNTYENERLDGTVVEYSDVVLHAVEAAKLAERLLFDGKTTVDPRVGIQLCAAIDAAGEVAPWREYMSALYRATQRKDIIHGEDSERLVWLSYLRGRLRLTRIRFDDTDREDFQSEHVEGHKDATEFAVNSVDVNAVSDWISGLGESAPEIIAALMDTLGEVGLEKILRILPSPSTFSLAYAERLAKSTAERDRARAAHWAEVAARSGPGLGTVHRLLRLGVPHALMPPLSERAAAGNLIDLTHRVLESGIQFSPEPTAEWMDACSLSARTDRFGLAAAEALLHGDGWFRCWLRFVVALCRAEAEPAAGRSSAALDALRLLKDDLDPFAGDPRACDLYRLEPTIASTLRRAADLVFDDDWEVCLDILCDVSEGITTSLQGSVWGPVPPGLVLDVTIRGTNPSRAETSYKAVDRILKTRSAGRFYSDVAGFRLARARVAMAAGDSELAVDEWERASALLVAYGWHKDVSIFELLEPLDRLTSVDPGNVRDCLAILQPLCERVVMHTDGKSTRQALSQWWTLLAGADPCALAQIASYELFRQCNLPLRGLEDARCALWEKQYRNADAFIAGALRLTIPAGLVETDPEAMALISAYARTSESGATRKLMLLLLARADERPVQYEVTNSDKYVQGDNAIVEQLNDAASEWRMPHICPTAITNQRGSGSETPELGNRLHKGAQMLSIGQFGSGIHGIADAILWLRRLGPDEANWSIDRLANAIGYRLVEAAQSGCTKEAISALWAIADSTHAHTEDLLAQLGAGLGSHGLKGLAALSYTLAWTSSRGSGGWFTFGGLTNIDYLIRAATLDSRISLDAIGQEVQRAITGTHSLWGISTALVHAFAAVDFRIGEAHSNDVRLDAFSCWREAAAIMSRRLPPINSEERIYPSYPPSESGPAILRDQLDLALATAAIAGVAHPGREQKRRSLIALGLLIEDRPTVAGEALSRLLEQVPDPLTLSWILAVLRDNHNRAPEIARACEEPLRRLGDRPHLVVRSLARELLRTAGFELQPLPIGCSDPRLGPGQLIDWSEREPDPEIQDASSSGGQPDGDLAINTHAYASGLVDQLAHKRLAFCEQLVPGITDAVKFRVSRSFNGVNHRRTIQGQLRALTSPMERRRPDAILDDHRLVEEQTQLVGGDIRASLAASGRVLSVPEQWESRFAKILLNDPRLPIAVESVRIPRPCALPSSSALAVSVCAESGFPNEPVPMDDIRISSITAVPIAQHPAGDDWKILGYVERDEIRGGPDTRASRLMIHRFCGVTPEFSEWGHRRPPLLKADVGIWSTPVPVELGARMATYSLMAGLDDGIDTLDFEIGLGMPARLLAPQAELVAWLQLRPGTGMFDLSDESGSGIAMLTWRDRYTSGDYSLAYPRRAGSLLAIRPDLFNRAIEHFGDGLVWSEYERLQQVNLGQTGR